MHRTQDGVGAQEISNYTKQINEERARAFVHKKKMMCFVGFINKTLKINKMQLNLKTCVIRRVKDTQKQSKYNSCEYVCSHIKKRTIKKINGFFQSLSNKHIWNCMHYMGAWRFNNSNNNNNKYKCAFLVYFRWRNKCFHSFFTS